MKGDPTINDILLFGKKRNVHCQSADESTIEDIDLTTPVICLLQAWQGRTNDALREPMEKDLTIDDILPFEKKRNVHCHSVGESPIEDIDLVNLVPGALHACRGLLD